MSSQHPLGSIVAPWCAKYPQHAGAIFQTFLDISLAQSWSDVTVVDLGPRVEAVALKGYKPGSDQPSHVLPASLSEPTSMGRLAQVFQTLEQHASSQTSPPPPPSPTTPSSSSPTQHSSSTPIEEIYLGVVDKDASVVYYVLKRGIVSPKEVRD